MIRQPGPGNGLGRPAAAVLTDRLATWLAEHDPGWRLPRRTDLARKYGVTVPEVDAAIANLADRHVVRAMADGQVYLASPAEYLVTLDRLPFPSSRIDPMGTTLTCVTRKVLNRAVPEGIGHVLRLRTGVLACAIQSVWEADGTAAAVSTTYLPAHLADLLLPAADTRLDPAIALNPVPPHRRVGIPLASPGALYLEVQPPPRWATRILQLRPGSPAITVTVRLDDSSASTPLALTIAVLHPGWFRVAVETAGGTPESVDPSAGTATLSVAPSAAEAPVTADHLRGKAG